MPYHIIDDGTIPRGMESAYAGEAIRQAEIRQQAEQEKLKADKEKREAIAATLEQFKQDAVKREEQEAKARGERERARFVAGLRYEFFQGNPQASESDWFGVRDKIVQQAMVDRAAGNGPVDHEKRRLLASGAYGF